MAVLSLDLGSISALRAWATGHGVDAHSLRLLTRWDHQVSDRPEGDEDETLRCQNLAALVTGSVPRLESVHGGVAGLLALVRAEVEEAWESTYRLDVLARLLRTVRRHPLAVETIDVPSSHLVRGIVLLLEVQELSILCEAAMTTGGAAAYLRHAQEAAQRCLEAEMALRATAQQCGTCQAAAQELLRLAEAQRWFTTALAAMAECLQGVPTSEQVDRAVATLRVAEEHEGLAESPLRSELRSHRLNLTALMPLLEQGIIHVDRGKISYLYPFAIRGIDPDRIGQRLTAMTESDRVSFAGRPPVDVRPTLDLDDVWNGADSNARRYEGVRVVLPDVLMTTEFGAEVLEADILVSTFGNHCVRFSRELRDLTAPEYFFVAFRGAPEHGRVPVTFIEEDGTSTGAPAAHRLCDLAMRVVNDLAVWTQGSGPPLRVAARPGMFQVVTTLTEVSRVWVGDHGAREEILDRASLMSCTGLQVLTNPVPYVIATALDWTRLAVENPMCDLGGSTSGQVTLRTPNTTVLIELGAPDWIRDTRSTMAEFAASLDGLLAAWSNELSRHFGEVRALRDRLLGASQSRLVGTAELVAISHALEAVRTDLSEFAIECKAVVNALRSPSLLSSPVAVEELRAFLSKSDFERRTRDLEIETNRVAYDQMNEALEKLESKVEARSRAKLEILLAVIGVAGLSGLVQIVQAGFAGSSATWEWTSGVAALAISLTAALFGILAWRTSASRAEDVEAGADEPTPLTAPSGEPPR